MTAVFTRSLLVAPSSAVCKPVPGFSSSRHTTFSWAHQQSLRMRCHFLSNSCLRLRRTVSVRTKDLLANVWTTKPRNVPSRLAMLDATASVPPPTIRLVVLLVLIIKIIAPRFATILTVETDAIEVAVSVGTGAKNDRIPVNANAALTLGSVLKLEAFEAACDLRDAGGVEDVVDGPGLALCEGVLVTTNIGVPAIAEGGFRTEDSTDTGVKTLVECVAKASTGMVEGPCTLLALRNEKQHCAIDLPTS